jgi:hypothetical protein
MEIAKMKTCRSLSIVALAFAVCLLPLSVRAADPAPTKEEMVDNPAYKSWAKHKPGTSVTMSMNTKMTAMEMKGDIVTKLVSVDKDKAVVETTTKMQIPGVPEAPAQPAQKQEIPAKVKKSQATPGKLPEGVKGTLKDKGKDTVEIGGKKYECKVWEFEGEAQGQKSTGKTWTSDEIPNTLAKMESNMTAGGQPVKSTITITKIETK